ncbi:MAG: ATP-binding protein [Acidimicrobiia bacterium]
MFVDFRLRATRFALMLSWFALGAFAVQIHSQGPGADGYGYEPLVGPVIGLLIVSAMPWRRLLENRLGDALLTAWAAIASLTLTFAPQLGVGEPPLAVYMVVVVFPIIVLPRIPGLIVATLSVGGFTLTAGRLGESLLDAGFAIELAALVGLAVIALLTAQELYSQVRHGSMQLREVMQQEARLLRREEELERLYAVSRSIGAGSSLAEVLPELVGRVTESVDASTGIVFMYRPDDQALTVVSPIWVSGDAVATKLRLLPLDEPGEPQRVFISETSTLSARLEPDEGAWAALVEELEITNLAAVPLRIESQIIGVLMVADKAAGTFTNEDLQALESLAAPSALVLDHLVQFQEARETGERMAELAELKSDFVSVVSHELRTPITSIIGALATLNRPQFAPSHQTARDLLGSAHNQANRLRRLIEDLLTASTIESEAVPMRARLLDLQTAIPEAVRAVPGAEDRVRLIIAPDLPRVALDPEHLRRIISNLIENSFKYGEGSAIEVGVRKQGAEVLIAVADHGPGVPFELSRHIFDRFTQLRRREVDGKGGIGLGLAIVQGLTQVMGGRIRYEPTIGGGATFTMTFPTAPDRFSTPRSGHKTMSA